MARCHRWTTLIGALSPSARATGLALDGEAREWLAAVHSSGTCAFHESDWSVGMLLAARAVREVHTWDRDHLWAWLTSESDVVSAELAWQWLTHPMYLDAGGWLADGQHRRCYLHVADAEEALICLPSTQSV